MQIVNKSFTAKEFTEYLKTVNFSAWSPKGVVLHNTWAPLLSQWNEDKLHNRKITDQQRLENIKAGYDAKGWHSGPHLFIDADTINVFSSLEARGTHSPSYNADYFGIELVGNYDVEAFPDSVKQLALSAIYDLYDKLNVGISDQNFHFHKEDPRTSHKACPGKNVGTKSEWITNVKNFKQNTSLIEEKLNVVVRRPWIPIEAINLVKRWEAFRPIPYDDRGHLAIGYGHTSKVGKPFVTPELVWTEEYATEVLINDLRRIADTLWTFFEPDDKPKITPEMFGALCSFAYNLGTTAVKGSKLLKLINTGFYKTAANEFPKWNKSTNPETKKKEELPGLTKRRLAEQALFLKGI